MSNFLTTSEVSLSIIATASVVFVLFSETILAGSLHTISFKIFKIKSRHRASNSVSEGLRKWDHLYPSNGWSTFGVNTDAQGLISAEENQIVEKCCLRGTLEVSRTIVLKKLFVCLSCHVLVFEEVNPITSFLNMAHQPITEDPKFSI